MDKIALLTPFVRMALMVIAGALVQRGLVAQEVADTFTSDPVVVDLLAGLALGAGSFGWYVWSASRAALLEAVGPSK